MPQQGAIRHLQHLTLTLLEPHLEPHAGQYPGGLRRQVEAQPEGVALAVGIVEAGQFEGDNGLAIGQQHLHIRRLASERQGGLGQLHLHPQGVEGEARQQRGTGGHRLPQLHQPFGHHSGVRGQNAGITVGLAGLGEGRLGRIHLGAVSAVSRLCVIELGAGDHPLGDQRLKAGELALGLHLLGLRPGQPCLGTRDGGKLLLAADLQQRLPRLHLVVHIHQHAGDPAAGLGRHRPLIDGTDGTIQRQPVGHRLWRHRQRGLTLPFCGQSLGGCHDLRCHHQHGDPQQPDLFHHHSPSLA
ncbi:hypothetical protein D3C72_642040 [compost metagenome]